MILYALLSIVSSGNLKVQMLAEQAVKLLYTVFKEPLRINRLMKLTVLNVVPQPGMIFNVKVQGLLLPLLEMMVVAQYSVVAETVRTHLLPACATLLETDAKVKVPVYALLRVIYHEMQVPLHDVPIPLAHQITVEQRGTLKRFMDILEAPPKAVSTGGKRKLISV